MIIVGHGCWHGEQLAGAGEVGGPIGVGSLAAVAAGAGAAAGAAAASSIGAAVLAGAAGGFAAGFVGSGGDLQAAGIGALTGGALGFVGGSSLFGPVRQGIKSALSPLRIAAHGVIGGVRSALQGGKFLRGALTGVVAKIATPFSTAIGRGNPIAGALASAAVGGTVSEIGGGKFANGALTGSYGYLFNEALTSLPDGNGNEIDQYTGRVVDVERGTRDGVIILGGMGALAVGPAAAASGALGVSVEALFGGVQLFGRGLQFSGRALFDTVRSTSRGVFDALFGRGGY